MPSRSYVVSAILPMCALDSISQCASAASARLAYPAEAPEIRDLAARPGSGWKNRPFTCGKRTDIFPTY